MYVRVATAQIKPGMLDEMSEQMVKRFEEGIALAQQIPGFLGHQFMINSESNKIAVISRWVSREAELANQQGSVQQQADKLGVYLRVRQT